MRKKFVSVALLAVLATMAVGCQKENIMEQDYASTTKNASSFTVNYAVDGVEQQVTLNSDDENDAFFYYLVTIAEFGHRVLVQGNDDNGIGSKEVITFSTTDKAVAQDWAKEKAGEGFQVFVEYKDGVYALTAIKKD